MTKDSVTMWPQDGYILETAKQLELDTSRGATTPMTKLKEEKDDLEPLSSLLATLYRSAVGRLLYLSHARFDIQYACRRLCQGMRAPTCIELRHLRHLTRYLLRTRGFGLVFPRGGAGDLEYIDVYVDSDWAGKENMRKSTSGGCIMVGGCCMVNWSRGQTVIAQSSGEAEFYAIIAGAHEGLAVQSTLAEIGIVQKGVERQQCSTNDVPQAWSRFSEARGDEALPHSAFACRGQADGREGRHGGEPRRPGHEGGDGEDACGQVASHRSCRCTRLQVGADDCGD